MTTGYLSIGSNIDRERHIPTCLRELRQLFGKLQISGVYESAAVGFAGAAFHNLAVKFESELSAHAVADQLRQIELSHGRSPQAVKFSSRTLDLDLLLFGDQIIDDARLRLPRADILQYAFVLEPLAEIAGEQLHPVLGLSYAQLWRNFDKQGLQQSRAHPDWLDAEPVMPAAAELGLIGG